MKHTIELDTTDIRIALSAYLGQNWGTLVNGRDVSIKFQIVEGSPRAVVTVEEKKHQSSGKD